MRIASAIASRLRSDEAIATRIQSVADAHYFARQRVPEGIFQMFEAGSGSNVTMRENVRAFEDVLFRPRTAVFHPSRDLRTTVLGHEISMPAIVSSVGFLKVGHPDGEAGVARAAGAAGTIQFVSGVSNTPIEEIMAAATGPVFYQLYYIGGRDASAPIIERVKAAGVSGLVLIADTPTIARPRDRLYPERRSVPAGVTLRDAIGFAPQALPKPRWLLDFVRAGIQEPQVAMGLRPDGTSMGLFEGLEKIYQQTPAWEDVPWIRERWDGPLVIKGILTVEDARRAVEEGADAIVVSNHGGNVLDGDVATLPVLAQIVEAVGSDIEVLIDSGVRRGTDVLKALALGADLVAVGRPVLWGLAADGAAGVQRVLEILRDELSLAMALAGCPTLAEVTADLIA